MQEAVIPVFLLVACLLGLAAGLLIVGNLVVPRRPGRVKRMPYESGMDPIHDARRRFDVRYHLVALAFLVFDVELLFLFPWAVALRQPERPEYVFGGGTLFLGLLALGFLYDWRKGIFQWR